MSSQYKSLKDSDIEFIKKQKLFYIASASDKEVNLSPKGYDSIKVIDNSNIVFMNYPGGGNRTFSDAKSDGNFTLLFNAFEGTAKLLRLFCKATIIEAKDDEFALYLKLFNEKESLVRNFFEFHIYAVEAGCGESVPYMEYKGNRSSLKDSIVKLDATKKLEAFKDKNFIPPDLKNI
ncbi:MAG: hypothetical protein ACJAWW_002850 [Sulfurimonas sp.]|jgi:hypothetical protein